jgi:hypothetical protein
VLVRGRIEEAVRYSDAGQTAMRTGRAMVSYAHDQIDQARAELNGVS